MPRHQGGHPDAEHQDQSVKPEGASRIGNHLLILMNRR
jgi:hypothetical protein